MRLIGIMIVLKILSIAIPLFISIAYFTGVGRKMMGAIQRRIGPNAAGFISLLQAFADGLKLFVKKTILPSNLNITIFLFTFVVLFLLSLVGWSVIPFFSKPVLADYVLISHFDLPTVYKFESIFDQIKNIFGHLSTEELNSPSSVEDPDLRVPTELEEKYPDLLEKKVLKTEKYREMVKQMLEKTNPDLLITDGMVTKYLELLEKEIQKAENEHFSVWLFFGSLFFTVISKWYFGY